MTPNQVLDDLLKLLLLLLPVIIPVVVPIIAKSTISAYAGLPANVKAMLASAAKTAVFAVEQLSAVGAVGLSDEARKVKATQILEADLASAGIHVPDIMISAAIEEAVLLLKLAQGKDTGPSAAPLSPASRLSAQAGGLEPGLGVIDTKGTRP